MTHPSVVTLLPAATEIVYALGIEPAATSHECDYPPAANTLPTACYSTLSGSTSAEINSAVADAATSTTSPYQLEQSVLSRINPDVVITQGICDVCAIDQATVENTFTQMDLTVDLISCHPHSFQDILDTILEIGHAIDRPEAATRLVASFKDRIQTITTNTQQPTPSIAVLDWMNPIMLAGHWVPDMVQIAGGTINIRPQTGESGPIPWDHLREFDPEKLLVAPCGYSLEQTIQNRSELTDRPGWETLRAVTNEQVYLVDGNKYFNRPGPRILDSLELLAHILHPDQFTPPDPQSIRTLSSLLPSPDTLESPLD